MRGARSTKTSSNAARPDSICETRPKQSRYPVCLVQFPHRGQDVQNIGLGYSLQTLHVTEYPGMRVHGAGARFPQTPWMVSYHRRSPDCAIRNCEHLLPRTENHVMIGGGQPNQPASGLAISKWRSGDIEQIKSYTNQLDLLRWRCKRPDPGSPSPVSSACRAVSLHGSLGDQMARNDSRAHRCAPAPHPSTNPFEGIFVTCSVPEPSP